jgi:PAS domain S-box-containing protein
MCPQSTELDTTRTERLAGLLVLLAHEPMFAWKLDGAIEFWSAGAEQLYGFASNDAIGRNGHSLLQTKFPIEFAELHAQLRNQRFWAGELRHTCKDGREVIVDSRMQLLDDDTVLEVNRDVTRLNALLADLQESEKISRAVAAIVESSDDAIVSKDLDGVITSWNKGAERMFGYFAEEAIGRPITIVIPHDRQDEEPTILTRIRRGEHIDHFETIRQRKNGSPVVVSLSVSPVKNAEGKIVGAAKIARDITEQKRSQELIATLAREAEHRSKNLLSTVQATIMLSQSDTADGLKKVIEGRIRALSNIHSLFVQTRWTGADLSTIAAQELAPFTADSATRVRIDGPPVLLAPDAAQAVAITLHELATNAVKYGALSAANGRVDLKWSHKAGGDLHLLWKETDGPKVQEPARKGFGSQVIEQMVASRSGKARFDWHAEGLVCEIILKV